MSYAFALAPRAHAAMVPLAGSAHVSVARLQGIIRSQRWLMEALVAARECDLPDWYIGGGVIRSVVWDHLHGYSVPTPLAGVDLAFFDPTDLSAERDAAVEQFLHDHLPTIPWDAANQAAVHLLYEAAFSHVVRPLRSTADGIAAWPDTASCVGVRLERDGTLRVLAPHGLHDLFALVLRPNPHRAALLEGRRRARAAEVARRWPRVTILEA